MFNDTVLLIVMLTAVLSYFAAFVLYLLRKLGKYSRSVLPTALFAGGVLCNLLVVIHNYLLNGYVPFVSMFQVLTFLAACFLPISLFAVYVLRCRDCEMYFALAAAIVMTAPVFMRGGAAWTFPPALQSVWFVPHIFVYMVSYSLGAVVFLMTLTYLIGRKKDGALFRSAYACAKIAFPFMTAGMMFGAIWADQVWGAFWSWDLKECWSLLSWLCYLLLLHCYRREKLRKWVPLFAILGFCGIIVTMFFVTGMVKAGGVSSMHAYA